MISILIPVYNLNVIDLVHSLEKQLSLIKERGEIIVLDDASLSDYKQQNQSIAELPHVTYQYLPENVGRLKIREKLAALATYDWLLFIDGDSQIIKDDFLSTYITAIQHNTHVVTGGRIYQSKAPVDCSF